MLIVRVLSPQRGTEEVGLILDSTVLISAERRGRDVRQALQQIADRLPGQEVALSVITVSELTHGVTRADSQIKRERRSKFVQELIEVVPVYAVTTAIAVRAGQIDGENTAKGTRVALADLLIGATALELGWAVATGNIRHFKLIPNLQVLEI